MGLIDLIGGAASWTADKAVQTLKENEQLRKDAALLKLEMDTIKRNNNRAVDSLTKLRIQVGGYLTFGCDPKDGPERRKLAQEELRLALNEASGGFTVYEVSAKPPEPAAGHRGKK